METIKMYVCGPTVYDHSHMGHARTYVVVDIIRRILKNIGNKRTHFVMNITDFDKKILNKATEKKSDWVTIAKEYESSFFESMSKLNVIIPDVVIRVSEVIPEIVSYIQKIIDKGFGYVTPDGSVYFDTDAFMDAGYEIMIKENDRVNKGQKKQTYDFALWKGRSDGIFVGTFTYDGKNIVSRGHPGWHIECSTMINKTLGSELDIHFGGIDLKFPHHCNEKLQAQAYHHPKFLESKWCEEFAYVGHLCIKGLKMSKSLKNFSTIEEILHVATPNQIRWLFIIKKWNESLDFGMGVINEAKWCDNAIINFFNSIMNYPFDKRIVRYDNEEFILKKSFNEKNDLIKKELCAYNLDIAANILFDLIRETNIYMTQKTINQTLVKDIYEYIRWLVRTLGFEYEITGKSSVNDVMDVLISTRSEIRMLAKTLDNDKRTKLFSILDKERDEKLAKVGIVLEDKKETSIWFEGCSKK